MLEIKAIGNLCQDAVIKDFNGQKLYGFTVATDESFTDKQGQKHEKTTYISCLKPIYNEQSTLGQYLKKVSRCTSAASPRQRVSPPKTATSAAVSTARSRNWSCWVVARKPRKQPQQPLKPHRWSVTSPQHRTVARGRYFPQIRPLHNRSTRCRWKKRTIFHFN